MKKNYLLIVACLLSFTSISIKGQDSLKPTSNNLCTELNFNPFNGSLSLNNSSGQFKFRRFYADNRALRIALTVNYLKDNSTVESKYGQNPFKESFRRSSLSTTLSIGTEKHFEGSRRLSPYIGWEMGVGLKKSKQVEKDNSTKITIDGAWVTTEQFYNGNYYYFSTTFSERGYWSLGASFVTGFDFYMAKGFYLGYEIAIGFDYINYSNIEYTPERDPQSGYTHPDYDSESWRIGPKLVNGIRIGYIF